MGKFNSKAGLGGRAQRLIAAVHAGCGASSISSNLSSSSQGRRGAQSANLDSVLSEGGRWDMDLCRPARLHPDSPRLSWSSPLGYPQESLLTTLLKCERSGEAH